MCLAIPGQVKELYEKDAMLFGKVDFGGVIKEVCLAYVPNIKVGEYVIVHVGFAINTLDEKSAQETLDLFRETGLLETEFSPQT